MHQIKFIKLLVVSFVVPGFISCSGSGNTNNKNEIHAEVKSEQVKINTEAQELISYLVEEGDYVNSRDFPSLIKAASVFEGIDGKNHIIDLRGPNSYTAGHIKGAVKVEFSDLPGYFKKDIKPSEFDKIILVCYSGQISSYAASLLRLMGYGNVFAMRWGMSGWTKDFAYQWTDALSSDFVDKLETTENEKAVPTDFPQIKTGKTKGSEIAEIRFNKIFETGYADALIAAEKVFKQPENYYIINYERKDKYESGHVPGAVRYKPGAVLGIISEMQTIPTDKEIVVYCESGHKAGFVTAYLRLFGYNTKSLLYGNNSFMYDKMVAEKTTLSWLPFTDFEIEDFPYAEN